jgi:Holliday junction DNA helicase RuvA
MIGYLKGSVASLHKTSANRTILTLEVNGVGYDVQIVPRVAQNLPPVGETVQIFTHLQLQPEQAILYGFSSSAQRDLFRQLVSVSGIGSQLAIALLDSLDMPDLVQAIVSGNTKILVQTPGVGKKTAERISLELRAKLEEWRSRVGLVASATVGLTPEMQEDIEMALLALGYTGSEVMQAIGAIAPDPELVNTPDPDLWIRRAIAWLSQS